MTIRFYSITLAKKWLLFETTTRNAEAYANTKSAIKLLGRKIEKRLTGDVVIFVYHR